MYKFILLAPDVHVTHSGAGRQQDRVHCNKSARPGCLFEQIVGSIQQALFFLHLI